MAAGLPGFLRHQITTEQAVRTVGDLVRAREARFLAVAGRLIYGNPASPYLRLLRWAGIEAGDLEAQVRRDGLDAALMRLRAAGVHLTLREFRGLDPIRRPGLNIAPAEAAFTNPRLTGAVAGQSSGSRSGGTSIDYGWAFLAEEAATERLLFAEHGLTRAALAMWLPVLPGIAGLHNLLLHLKAGPAVQTWFSQAPVPEWRSAPVNRAALEFAVRCGGRTLQTSHAPIGNARPVAAWLANHAAAPGSRHALKTYASSAVRVAEAALAHGFDLRGQVVFTGGEPLTVRRRRYIESAGLTVHPRYATTECGMVGGACARASGDAPDLMHVYVDRLAVVPGGGRAIHDGHSLHDLVFTTLSLNAPRVLLNVDLGDWGVLEHRACDCRFGAQGMHLFVSRLTSPDKLTGEGMTLLSSDIDDIVGRLVERAGGAPEDYQFSESYDDRGLAVLTIVISPALPDVDEASFARQVFAALGARPGGHALASTLWRDADAVRIVRRTPQMTGGYKMPLIVRRPDA